MLIDDFVMSRNTIYGLLTIPCLGQVLTLFRRGASKTVYPVQDSEAKKPYLV